uniref:Serine palmitoyltransferase small subunit A n=1 Tax=Oryctolagus cuniculus TaxID=9986 RepID=G1TPU7_RABIT
MGKPSVAGPSASREILTFTSASPRGIIRQFTHLKLSSYLLVTALYMLEPWERTVFNSMLVSVVGMALYTGYVFMPQHIMAILHYFEVVQ